MRKTLLLLASIAVASCSDSALVTDLPLADLSIADAPKLPDMATPDSAGIQCGSMTCSGNNDCCLLRTGSTFQAMCMARGSCDLDAGASLMCDGPEDCTTGMAECCINVNGSGGGTDGGTGASASGQSLCVNRCVAVVNVDASFNFTAHTRMCHRGADCNGLSGDVFSPFGNFRNTPFASCCMGMQTQGFSVCLPSQASSFSGITCM